MVGKMMRSDDGDGKDGHKDRQRDRSKDKEREKESEEGIFKNHDDDEEQGL